ncbi:cell division protein FtsA [bacterium]|nr:cell division protein FtsA [bacterium]
MSRTEIIAGIDLGSRYIRCIVAEASKNSSINILGIGKAVSKGIRQGVIINIEDAYRSILEAVQEAEHIVGFKLKNVYVGLGSKFVSVQFEPGSVAITSQEKIITENDIRKVKDSARSVAKIPQYNLIQIVPCGYTVDGFFAGIKEPVNMSGLRLELNAMIVTAMETYISNISKAIDEAGLEIDYDGFVLGSYCSALSTLSEEMKDLGVLLMDIGSETTNVIIYRNKRVTFYRFFPFGGENLTRDISNIFGIKPNEAERLKITKGIACADLIEEDEELTGDSITSNTPIKILKEELAQVIEMRMNQILGRIKQELNVYLSKNPIGAIVLTGGTSNLNGIETCVGRLFDRPVRIGKIIEPKGLSEELSKTENSMLMGLVLHGASKSERKTDKPPSKSKFSDIWDKILQIGKDIF